MNLLKTALYADYNFKLDCENKIRYDSLLENSGNFSYDMNNTTNQISNVSSEVNYGGNYKIINEIPENIELMTESTDENSGN